MSYSMKQGPLGDMRGLYMCSVCNGAACTQTTPPSKIHNFITGADFSIWHIGFCG